MGNSRRFVTRVFVISSVISMSCREALLHRRATSAADGVPSITGACQIERVPTTSATSGPRASQYHPPPPTRPLTPPTELSEGTCLESATGPDDRGRGSKKTTVTVYKQVVVRALYCQVPAEEAEL